MAAGSKFTLGVQFENTGIMKVENVVLTVDGGENFTMDSSTNTYFYKSIAAGGSQSQEIPMQAVPTGKSGAQSINFSFKYDYTDGEKRTQATSDIKISVPVYQPDRFQINPPTVPETVYVGEESEVTLTYVNKGKDDIANVEASVEGDGVDTPAKVQYLGNITAGANGNFGFALTPNMEGEIKLVLKIAYENADQQVQTREFPITLRAEELSLGTDVPDEDWEEPAQGGLPLPVILALAAAAVAAVAAAAVILVRRKKAAAKTESAAWDNWEDGGDQDRYDGEA